MPKKKTKKPLLPKFEGAETLSNDHAKALIETYNTFLLGMAAEVDRVRRLPHENDLDISYVMGLLELYRRVSKPLQV